MLVKKVLDNSLKIHLKTALVLNCSIIKIQKNATLTKKLIFIKKSVDKLYAMCYFIIRQKGRLLC